VFIPKGEDADTPLEEPKTVNLEESVEEEIIKDRVAERAKRRERRRTLELKVR